MTQLSEIAPPPKSPHTDSPLDDEDALLQTYLRGLQNSSFPLISIGLFLAAAVVLLWVTHDAAFIRRRDMMGIALCAVSFAAWRLRLHYPYGAWVIALGTSSVVVLGSVLFQLPAALTLLALPCLLVTVYLGLKAGIIWGAIVSGLLITLFALQPAYFHLESLDITLIAIWCGIALVGAALRPLRTATAESWYHYSAVRRMLEESRDRQEELNQAYEDLHSAYKEMGRLNAMLLATQRAVDEARQAKETFVANVSHELRTPLNMIIGFSSLIAKAPLTYRRRLPPELLADISAIQRNAMHLSKLVDDVLDLSKADAGYMKISLSYASIPALSVEAAQAVQSLFDSKHLWIRMEIAPDLPDVLCDATRIRQVILNLLSNAGRVLENGGVTIRAWVEKNEAVVTVEDTGPGISEEEKPFLFEPFRQLEIAYRGEQSGTGLGLAISRKLVELHGGRMWLESKPSAGACFAFSLPIEAPPKQTSGPGRWISRDFAHRRRADGHRRELPAIDRRVLFIDAEGSLYSSALYHLRDQMELALASTIGEAVADLCHTTAQMAVLNQSDAAQLSDLEASLRAVPYWLPVVACSAPSTPSAAAHLGVDGYLIKPISHEDLLSAVTSLDPPADTILIVDDEDEAVQLFARMLAAHERNYTILRASSGARALELMRSRRPDLVLLDLVMPDMTGFEVLAARKQEPALQNIRIVVTSAQDPIGEPVITSRLTLSRSSGFTSKELIDVIGALAQTVTPVAASDAPARPNTPRG
ncbi:MAG: hybrid sensor histidine kinase/response regulator [Chloroflexota bacterium]|nr:hybrid sensor histidine kinase/response regulator [Chloroflexota bacterium]